MSTIKINWGAGIAVVYIGFMGLIATLVVGSMRQKTDLVSTNYYEQELKYQNLIDAGKNQSALSAPVGFTVSGDAVKVQFPADFAGKELGGTIQFYSPVQNSWDKTIKIDAVDNEVLVERSLLHPTTYTVKVDWTAEGKNYYQETNLNLSKQ
jgi:nitrogen fixation protein FixH